jgi:hypothetical protein
MNEHYDYLLSVLLIVLAVLFLDPFMVWMSDAFLYMLIAFLFGIFVIFALFFWRERAQDERDELHKMIAGRFGYLAGAGALVVGIAHQSLFGYPDPWLVVGLLALVLGKLFGTIWGKRKS